jgi:hypothetical protein
LIQAAQGHLRDEIAKTFHRGGHFLATSGAQALIQLVVATSSAGQCRWPLETEREAGGRRGIAGVIRFLNDAKGAQGGLGRVAAWCSV